MTIIRFSEITRKIADELGISRLGARVKFTKKDDNLFEIIPVEEQIPKSLQYLFFGQNSEHIIPLPWIQASWKYLDKFRCTFGFNGLEAILYSKITIIGTPDLPTPVTQEQENLIRESFKTLEDFQIERLWVKTPEELEALLEERIEQDKPFYGGDVGPHAPSS